MKNYGTVACGHEETAKAAAQILEDGGNAFDAVVAGLYAACVAEPVLASLGGGGFLLAKPADKKPILYDFFTQTPRQKKPDNELSFYPVNANFGETTQEFHIGPGAIATPGCVKGLFDIHQELCTRPLKTIIEPAINLAKNGVRVNPFQAYIFNIISPIYLANANCRRIFQSQLNPHATPPQLITNGELLCQPELADTLDALSREGADLFYQGDIARSITNLCAEKGGHLSMEDFRQYQTIKRSPLQLCYRDHMMFTNPPPSIGGVLIAFALKLLENVDVASLNYGSAKYIQRLAYIMDVTNQARVEAATDIAANNTSTSILDADYLTRYQAQIGKRFTNTRGTTHISVMDKQGNIASMTVSNGEGCGDLIPHTGIMLNNMLGEQDLNPKGFHLWQQNQRISSMMSPTIIYHDPHHCTALGSGGSNRIRTAILQVLIHLLDFNMQPEDAVQTARIHYENGLLNLEDGFSPQYIAEIEKEFSPVLQWSSRNLFFGGVHSVSVCGDQFSGVGDARRGGFAITT